MAEGKVKPLIDRVLPLEQVCVCVCGGGVFLGNPGPNLGCRGVQQGSVVCRFWQASENLGLHSFAVNKTGL
jgi:hypothetical protein